MTEPVYRDLDPPSDGVASVYAIELHPDGSALLFRGGFDYLELPAGVVRDLYAFLTAHQQVFLQDRPMKEEEKG